MCNSLLVYPNLNLFRPRVKIMKAIIKAMILACAVIQATAQTLNNGIILPAEWPPRYGLPTVAKEMPVPYLTDKPSVMPINNGRQLFVDSFLIARTNLKSVYHTPDFYQGNPVLEPSEEWEKTTDGAPYAAPFSDGIWYDDKERIFKMWYLAGAGMMHKQSKQTFYTCYAESEDGKKWHKVNLDVVPGTNICDTCRRDAATIWLDREESNPERRWKMFVVQFMPRDKRFNGYSWQLVLKYSPDGRHWSRGVAQSGEVEDRTSAFFNPFTRRWVISMRGETPVSFRSRYYIENANAETLVSVAHRPNWQNDDQNVRFWFTPDDKELRHPKYPEVKPGIYNFDCIAYESIMLGQYSAWCGPENNVCKRDGIQKRNVIELGYSRDGFHFARPSHQPFMNVNETEGAWNWGNVQSINGTPLIVGDSLYFYCSGRRLNNIMWDSYTSTGLATLRRDGFVSLHADKKEGYITTERLTFDGRYFFVNADLKAKGASLRVELLDADGNPIPGFTKAECIAMQNADKTKQMITWKTKKDVAELAGRTVSAKFYIKNGDLYAFWVSPWASGESRGYIAGGGPGLNFSGQDVIADTIR